MTLILTTFELNDQSIVELNNLFSYDDGLVQ
jgi:hypothetical protein